MSAPKLDTLSSLVTWVRDKTNTESEVDVVNLVGEHMEYDMDTTLELIYKECRSEDGFLYCQYLSSQTLG